MQMKKKIRGVTLGSHTFEPIGKICVWTRERKITLPSITGMICTST